MGASSSALGAAAELGVACARSDVLLNANMAPDLRQIHEREVIWDIA